MASDTAETVSHMRDKEDEEVTRFHKRKDMKARNLSLADEGTSKSLDSSLKRHTAFIKRLKQSLAMESYESIMKDIASLSLEKYVDELPHATIEGVLRCKTERDVWSAVEIISALHRRFSQTFTPALLSLLGASLTPGQRAQVTSAATTQTAASAASNAVPADIKEKEDASRISRQRPMLRVCSELALVGIIRDSPSRSGGEWMMKVLKELLSNDPTLSSLPLLSTFLKTYARPYLGIIPGSAGDPDAFPTIGDEEDELVEKETRSRFKKMCEGYFENVSRKLTLEHKRLQEQDRRNHEAYIKSGEIFEDRQQAYERLSKTHEKLLASCQILSELLNLPMPALVAESQMQESALHHSVGQEVPKADLEVIGGKWEDEEERRFFEDIQDLRDFVPKSVLGLEETDDETKGPDYIANDSSEEEVRARKEMEEREAQELELELRKLNMDGDEDDRKLVANANGDAQESHEDDDLTDDDVTTPIPSPIKPSSPVHSPSLAPQGPSQLLTALLARLPECINRALIDSAAVEFTFLNSKAARKRLVKFMTQVPKNRIDLLPHYSRLVATLSKYMPDVGDDLVAALDEEFRYLQRKKNVKELNEVRQKNLVFLSNLTKFGVVPSHVILHMFKVCLDDFAGTNIDNLAILLEGCGRYLLRSDNTKGRFATMIELMRRKQSLQHLDQRQTMILENAYYHCNPPDRTPIVEKERTPMELFIRHLVYDVLSKKTIDKVLRLLRKLHWDEPDVVRILHTVFTKPWKIKHSNISLLAMLTYDLIRYHPDFAISTVDQVLENIRLGLESNAYKANQQRVATVKYLGELYIYRLISSSIIFDTLWTLVTFGHPDGRPLPGQACPLDMPDDFFRIRLVCVLLDTCGMCFDKGTQQAKLDKFLVFFQLYVFTKEKLPMDIDFMLEDTLEAVRPKMVRLTTFEDAAKAVDTCFLYEPGAQRLEGEEEDDDSEDSDDDGRDGGRHRSEDDEEDAGTLSDSQTAERPQSPDTLVLLNERENQGPTEEDDNEFARELAKMVTDSSAESKKVDRRTAQALWDSAVVPNALWKKKDSEDEASDENATNNQEVMKFKLLTKKGNKQQSKSIAIPSDTALATHTRSAQLQNKVEQQQLKQLVLNYEQREETEEMKAAEARSRNPVKIRLAG